MRSFSHPTACLLLEAFVYAAALKERPANLRRGGLYSDSESFDPTRPDFEIFNRTLTEVRDNIRTNSGESYPLITYTRAAGSGAFSFERYPVLPKRELEELNTAYCVAGGPTLVGVMSVADDRHSRDRQRAILRRFGEVSMPPLCTSIVYVIGSHGLDDDTMKTLSDEQDELGDLVLLDIKENMNEGKSFAWFKHAVDRYPSAKFIGKSDVDAFLHPRNLAVQLARLPNTELLYGFDCGINKRREYIGSTKNGSDMVPLWESGSGHMAGAFYLFSSDLLQCSLPTAENHKDGIEDATSSSWPLLANCSHKFAADMFRFFDHESRRKYKYNQWWQHIGWQSEPVLIHFLKEDDKWDEISNWLCESESLCL